MRFTIAALCFFAFLVPAKSSAQDAAQMILQGGGRKAYLQSEGFYHAVFPSSVKCKEKNVRDVACVGQRGPGALRVRVLDVPKTATSALVMLNDIEAKEKKLIHFKEIAREKVQYHGSEGLLVRFRFNQRGNSRRTMIGQELVFVNKGKLYKVEFESHSGVFSRYEKGLTEFFGTFEPAPLGEDGRPILPKRARKKKRPTSDAEFLERRKNKDPYRTSY